MTFTTTFTFRSKSYQTKIYLDYCEAPLYIFTIIDDTEIIDAFGEDVYIKTDGKRILPMLCHYPSLNELRQSIFNVVKERPEFQLAQQLVNSKAVA
ncbi:MAG TPA: hypothetical protein VD794_13620 [Flavisolibacter sp.]|nr:hypothetical protein [Flavisolibacter sp.]